MDLFRVLSQHAQQRGDQAAVSTGEESITYRQLEEYSDRLAACLLSRFGPGKEPFVVYGHKSPWMLVCFLACAKAGRAYCPIDISLPAQRLTEILEETQTPVLLCTQPLPVPHPRAFSPDLIQSLAQSPGPKPPQEARVQPEDIFYIIFTSGSTGRPKGVQIPRRCLENFLDWSSGLADSREEKAGAVFLNQAPFSFDLSVLDTYTCLFCGGTLRPMTRSVQEDYGALMDFFRASQGAYFVSTPSFAALCLADPRFCQELLPRLRAFLFCGETLPPGTARALLQRFPRCQVINTYGPTETTVCVTQTPITLSMTEKQALPVGRPKEGITLEIWSPDGTPLPCGEQGEIVILGDTVGAGYFRRPDVTEKVFCSPVRQGKPIPAYRTGDLGFLSPDGMLHFIGRGDHQIKLHGYRIELGDVEENLLKLPGVRRAVVLPQMREGAVHALVGFVERESGEDSLAASLQMKKQLRTFLPGYMVPKKLVFLPKIPVTPNGKTDRKTLEGMLP